MSATVILGYDVETASENTAGFLEGAEALHDKFGVPWTIYLTGKTIEKCADDISRVMRNPLLTIGRHTYNHTLLKSIYMRPADGKPIHGSYPNFFRKGGSLAEISEEIEKTQVIVRDKLTG
ncbi:polysaccharide deacetylase family protein [Verrucomicrobiota bacterium]